MKRVLSAILVFLTAARSLHASAVEPPVREWFDVEWERSQRVPDLAGWNLRYEQEIFPTMTPREADSLRRQVVDKPDHPGHSELTSYDRYTATGRGSIIRFQLFAGGDDLWRWCRTHADEFWDSAMSDDAAWTLTSKSASVYSPDDVTSAAVTQRTSMLLPDATRFLSGGLGISRTSNLEVRSFEMLPSSSWRAVTGLAGRPESGYAQVFSGRWDPAFERGFVEESVVYHDGYPGAPVQREVFEDWRFFEPLSAWIAHAIKRYDRRGRHERTFRLLSIDRNTADIREIVRTPALDSIDAVRGRLTITEVADHRNRVYRFVDKDGTQREGVIHPTSPTSPWRRAGWIALGILGLAAVMYFLRRSA